MKFFIPILVAAIYVPSSSAADTANGGKLHAKNCTACHDSALYTRDNRRVQSLASLETQVRFCKDNLGLTWFDDEVDDVVAYLNETYYHY